MNCPIGFEEMIQSLRQRTETLEQVLFKARAFVEDELDTRKISFLPENSPYIDDAQSTLDAIDAALAPPQGTGTAGAEDK